MDQSDSASTLRSRLEALEAELRTLAAAPQVSDRVRSALKQAATLLKEVETELPGGPIGYAGRVQATIQTVGIAVQDLEAARQRFEAIFQAPLVRQAVHIEEGSQWAWYQLGPIAVELIAPTGRESKVQRFLDRRGEGLFLIAVEVPSMETAIEGFRAAGLRVIYDQGRDTFPGGGRNNFIHPKDFFGTMIEFRERPEAQS